MVFRQSTPAEGDLLCESCGYILNGLEATPQGNCPECGEPLAMSVDPGARKPAPIELAWTAGNFWRTTLQVLLRKRKFFRETLTRRQDPALQRFGRWHRAMAGTLFGLAAAAHLAYLAELWTWIGPGPWTVPEMLSLAGISLVLIAISILLVNRVTALAIWMAAKESRWWGMRLPTPVLRRAMNFHAANYLPVGVVAVIITVGYRLLLELHVLTLADAVPYLVSLSVAVVGGAFWLFESFVIAMRRIRYANF